MSWISSKETSRDYCYRYFFPLEKAHEGYICAQLYAGKASTFAKIYGIKRTEQKPETLQDFIRQWRAFSGLISDSAGLDTSKAFKTFSGITTSRIYSLNPITNIIVMLKGRSK